MTDRAKLVTQVLTSFFNEAKFYGDNSKEMQETIQAVIKKDPAFVSSLAVFARRVFNMRSVSHVLTGYLAHTVEGKPYTRKTVMGVVQRGDDATEILSFYLNNFGKPIPNSLRKGLADVFGTFDEYTLAKYKGQGKGVKMRDVLCLCRPTPKDENQSALWKRLLEGRLETPVTWETQLSAKGNSKETWESLIDSGKVGYMALLRNLRNIVQAGPANIEKVYAVIEDPEAVKRSRQLPFRFLSAYKSVSVIAGSRAFNALESAVEASVQNMPRLGGTTVIAVDVSGSMSSPISAKSDIRCCEIGMMLGLIANKMCDNSIFYTFENKIEKPALSSRNGILYTAVKEAKASGGTDMDLPFEKMMEDRVRADRIILISDNMCNAGVSYWNKTPVQSLADQYRQKTGNDLWVHAIDLQGYGTQQFHGRKTNIIAGWSEKVFDFIRLAEQGEGTLEETIANYQW
ncbi:MAG: TROVE domain-containing protein [Clostridia bacterium]|nr:TROVE domain-containing protein [Clostridia bacterium]